MKRGLLSGFVSALITAALVLLLPEGLRAPLLAGLLWLTVGIYMGMALMDRRPLVGVELGGQAVVLGLALASTWWPLLLVPAWLLHAVWDLLHHGPHRPVKTRIHPIVVPFCIVYDVLVAGLAAWVALA